MKILKLPAVIEKTGLSRSTIYAKLSSDEFPQPIKLSIRSIGWVEDHVDAWLLKKIESIS